MALITTKCREEKEINRKILKIKRSSAAENHSMKSTNLSSSVNKKSRENLLRWERKILRGIL